MRGRRRLMMTVGVAFLMLPALAGCDTAADGGSRSVSWMVIAAVVVALPLACHMIFNRIRDEHKREEREKAEREREEREKAERERVEREKVEHELEEREMAEMVERKRVERDTVERQVVECNGGRLVTLPNGQSMTFVFVPHGTFHMGSPESEEGRYSDETSHAVTLTKDYYVADVPTTCGQWKALVGDYPDKYKMQLSGTEEVIADIAMHGVSWEDAARFAAKLDEQERIAGHIPDGYEFRLPTEAEWEYACRGGKVNRAEMYGDYGNADLDEIAWYDGNARRPMPVGCKRGSDTLKIFDMLGNVWEWCNDWYSDSYGDDATDPHGPSEGSVRVLRGGAWRDYARDCRTAYRNYSTPSNRDIGCGFRVVLAPSIHCEKVERAREEREKTECEMVEHEKEEREKVECEMVDRNSGRVVILPNGQSMTFVFVPHGTFHMGSPESEEGRYGDETLHVVTLTKDYWIGQTPVTRGQWRAVMEGADAELGDDAQVAKDGIDYYDAREYCRKLTESERKAGRIPDGYEFRLPTEAEWEHACRGGCNRAGAYGDYGNAKLKNIAWYHGNAHKPMPVGQKKASDTLKIFDMIGNVWEWCEDWYGWYEGDATDPRGPSTGFYWVLRGGCWCSGTGCYRAARRGRDPSRRVGRNGFRVVLAPIH